MNISGRSALGLFSVSISIRVVHTWHVIHILWWVCGWDLALLGHHVAGIVHAWWGLLVHSRVGWDCAQARDWLHLFCWGVGLVRSLLVLRLVILWLVILWFIVLRLIDWRHWLLLFTLHRITSEHFLSMAEIPIFQNNLLIKQKGNFNPLITEQVSPLVQF